jgi:hypothetical protein
MLPQMMDLSSNDNFTPRDFEACIGFPKYFLITSYSFDKLIFLP